MKLKTCSFDIEVKGKTYMVCFASEANSWGVMTAEGKLLFTYDVVTAPKTVCQKDAEEVLSTYLNTEPSTT